ncbi:MAG: DEAD/DEAH box helicase [Pyrinomonadaceae bacterium]
MKSLGERFEEEVFNPYCELLKAEYRFNERFAHAKQVWSEKLTMTELVNGAFLEKSQIYQTGESIEALPLQAETRGTIKRKLSGRNLYRHQTDAIAQVLRGENTVVATGTSSGKTLCYQLPILDDLIRDDTAGLRAIIIYPLNALVNDQLEEWSDILRPFPNITFARFTGQTPDDHKDFVSLLTRSIAAKYEDGQLKGAEKDRAIDEEVKKQLDAIPTNQRNHREEIRATPPNILITNFSMLEYLLERPIDDSIFRNARLKFLVLDEVHAYRGVQATEIGFLVRRLKDRLTVKDLTCVATSATLGKRNDAESEAKVREFVSRLFDGEFRPPNPIYGIPATPELLQPSFCPAPEKYIEAAELLRNGDETAAIAHLAPNQIAETLAELLRHDENLFKLRNEILVSPIKLDDAAEQLWVNEANAVAGLQAFLEIAAHAKADGANEDLLPTRLHYFVKAQDGLYVCLHENCPARIDGKAAYFVSRRHANIEEGFCPECSLKNQKSMLVEIVTCRKCGYLYGAMQDLGPKKWQEDGGEPDKKPQFDAFQTELGWGAESFWSYFSVERDLPFPDVEFFDDEDENPLTLEPSKLLSWCVECGKKSDKGAGDTCQCPKPHLREIYIFHRQCQHDKKKLTIDDLERTDKKLLSACPNCDAKNTSGLEPVRRFQESDDETGMAMAIPLSHFQVTPNAESTTQPRKLLCFTDNRQRAAAFPALLEEETFTHDLGRKILEILDAAAGGRIELETLGKELANRTNEEDENFDPKLFLPTSRFPDQNLNADEKKNLWLSETFAYFGVPDSARESIEDLGLAVVEYEIKKSELNEFRHIIGENDFSPGEANAALQTLLAHLRHRKAFTLPKGKVANDDLAFGRVIADIYFAEKSQNKAEGWLPKNKTRDNYITDYLKRLCDLSTDEAYLLAEKIWKFLTESYILTRSKKNSDLKKLDHESFYLTRAAHRFVCNRCGIITAFSAKNICPRKSCKGVLEEKPFDAANENLIARWVSGRGEPKFYTLKSEEHTAQINKNYAKQIEDSFSGKTKKIQTENGEEVKIEGINLLSSTTTFEMGINIGDLQKVLLRNAPPTSASYVQRVGRAGRGHDKNAICVTLCKRTKYDADAWENPSDRLMTGEISPPTVFIENRFIAQRHFNAVVFARFLREKLNDENVLGETKQRTPLAPFLAPEKRATIPAGWLKFQPTDAFLDFPAWLDAQTENDIFMTDAKTDLLRATGGFANGTTQAKEMYAALINNVGIELSSSWEEREHLFKQGFSTKSVEDLIKNLLDSDVIALLAKRGFLPRYAFPLDVVNLETSLNRWSGDSDVSLSRDRALAIAEFAPGSQVIARKKIFTSAGLYIAGREDKVTELHYVKCPNCAQIKTAQHPKDLGDECEVCGKPVPPQHVRKFIVPNAFTIKIGEKETRSQRHRRSSFVRQRQSLTHFIDAVKESDFEDRDLFKIALKDDGKLFRYNLGRQNEGFVVCQKCGFSEFKKNHKPNQNHDCLRNIGDTKECDNKNLLGKSKGVAFGHQFESFCLIVRPQEAITNPELSVSLAYALHKGLCRVLETETSDIGVSGRAVTNRQSTNADENTEFVFFDKTPGGAGFVKEAKNNWDKIIAETLQNCSNCNCERACYNCLKDYYNQSVHRLLNRNLVRIFLV